MKIYSRDEPNKHININPLENFKEMQDYSKQELDADESDNEPSSGTMSLNRATQSGFDRGKPHTFTFNLTVHQGTMLMGTVGTLPKGKGYVSTDLSNAILFTVVGYHSDLNHVFFYFTTKKLAIGHLNDRSQMKYAMNRKEFGSWPQAETKVATIAEEDEFYSDSVNDALGVALHLHSRTNENVKDVILAVNVRNTVLTAKPWKDVGHFWATQLAELFTLTDWEIPGYELPRVTNDVHITLENVVLAYDHKFSDSNDTIRLRAVLGQCYVNCAIVTDMQVYKTMCILERARLFMSSEAPKSTKETVRFSKDVSLNKKEETKPVKQFVQICDIGLIQVEFLFSTIVDPSKRMTPLYELKCRNDIVKIWVCADSLVTLLNIATDLMKPQSKEIETENVPKGNEKEEEEDDQDDEDTLNEESTTTLGQEDNASEKCGSTWSNPSYTRPLMTQMPTNVEQRVQRMMDSAMKERSNSSANDAIEGTEMGLDAVDEFSPAYSLRQARIGNFIFSFVETLIVRKKRSD
ncbi:hypothetical protein WR25_01397 [Diploscapter pachys]|uniref:Autophagy-related protein 2 n=1 Tax=Diploscapter pachys TaxID=2018661 RepID=A0A2A2LXG2_9BILA|nr:hypothetical protein WR25_01397 [Diploscapter pachys]